MARRAIEIPSAVRTAVRESLRLIEQTRTGRDGAPETLNPDPLPSLLEQCGRLAGVGEEPAVEPIRTIHHFACTGGTLITKCLACSPNVHVLSEVDPLSTLAPAGGKFTPADLMRLAQFSNRAPSQKEKIELFLSGLSSLYRSNLGKGLRLLVRDHAHSHFCVGPEVPQRPSLADLLRREYPVRSIVTVRHPVESWLAIMHNKWLHFQPADVDEYAKRYEAFLDCYAEYPIFRYEDFLETTDHAVRDMTEALGIPFPDGYKDLFMVHAFSGDSGRKGNSIENRPRREMSESAHAELAQSNAMRRVCRRLNYEWDL